MDNHDLDLLTKNILLQAEYYLNASDEFYPFGCSIRANGELSPFSVYMEDDHPLTTDVLDELEKGTRFGIKKNKFKAAAIGVDVYLTVPNLTDKVSAIQIRYFPSGVHEEKYFSYSKINGKYVFEPAIHPNLT